MYYHIKITKKNGNTIYLYDKDEKYAKAVKDKFLGNDDFIIDGNRVEIKELESCKIIITEYNADCQAEHFKSKFPNGFVFKEDLFRSFDNMFDKL